MPESPEAPQKQAEDGPALTERAAEPSIESGSDGGTVSGDVVQADQPSVNDLLAGRKVEEKEPYRDRKNEQKLRQRSDEHELRKTVAKWVYLGTAAQVVVADVAFYLYAWLGRDWNVPTEAISVWLSATVVQVIAVVLVITRYLFAPRQKK